MSYTNVEDWYCCLAEPERGAFEMTAGYVLSMPPFMPKALYDLYWTASGALSASQRSHVFVESYGLTLDFFPPGDPDGIEVYYLDPLYWTQIRIYTDSHPGACSVPCRLRTFPL